MRGSSGDGLLLYGLWWNELSDPPKLSFESWPGGTEHDTTKLFGEGWTVWLWEVKVAEWPSEEDWGARVTQVLKAILAAGAVTAWAGLEWLFVDPPALFDPGEMSGGVWAAALPAGRVYGPPPLGGTFRPLDDSTLAELRNEAIRAKGA